MALPDPDQARELLHSRSIEVRGYVRTDGLFDIEARLLDTKAHDFHNGDDRGVVRNGQAVHDMYVRVTIDERMVIQNCVAITTAAPYRICPNITPEFAVLKGVVIGPGWRQQVKALLGGVHGCAHLVELLGAVATASFQTLVPLRWQSPDPMAPPPPYLNSCHALADDSEIVKRRWPAFYTGTREQ